MNDPGEEPNDTYAEFLRRTKEPEPQTNRDLESMSWRTFALRMAVFFIAATAIVMFFRSDTAQARGARSSWLSECRTRNDPSGCTPVADEWHHTCFYMRAGGQSRFDQIPNPDRERARRRHRREYNPDEYRKCMDEHAHDIVTGQRVDKMLREKEEAVRKHELEAR